MNKFNKKKIKEPSIEEIMSIKNLINSGKFVEAEKKTKLYTVKYPHSFNLLNVLGVSLIAQKKFAEAKKIYTSLIKIKPNFAEVYNNLANIYMEENNNDEAIYYFEKAISIKPDLPQANFNLSKIYTLMGNNLQLSGNFEDAITSYKKAIESQPNNIDAHNNLGVVLNKIGKFDDSISHYKIAIKIKPNFEQAYNNLAVSLVNEGSPEEANKMYNEALRINPKKTQYAINANLILPIIPESNDEIKSWRNKYNSNIDLLKNYKYSISDPQNEVNPATFYLSYCELNNLEIVKKLSKLFRNIIPIINFNFKKDIIKAPVSNKNLRIKIGFISEFLTDHTIGKLYKGLIKEMDRKKFEVIVFHMPKTKRGIIKNEIDSFADNVITLDEKIINQHKKIKNELLDIIFYPDIGMSSSTYFLCHSRLAPIQVMSWGHPESSGISTIDYFLSSSFIENDDSQSFYSEKLVCLNRIPMYFIPPHVSNLKTDRYYFDLMENKNIYCCPQTLIKIHPDFDKALSKIIEKDNNSQIIMIEPKYKSHKEKLKNRWLKNYPNLYNKVMFLKRMPLDEFLSLMNVSDVLLDPFYFGAGLSFSESMLVGTPTVTMPGKFMRSRIVAGAYKQMKILNPPVAENIDDYVAIATELAKNKKRNNELKKSLKNEAKIHLFNDLKALKEIEEFFVNSVNKHSSII